MIVITTSNSISVNPRARRGFLSDAFKRHAPITTAKPERRNMRQAGLSHQNAFAEISKETPPMWKSHSSRRRYERLCGIEAQVALQMLTHM